MCFDTYCRNADIVRMTCTHLIHRYWKETNTEGQTLFLKYEWPWGEFTIISTLGCHKDIAWDWLVSWETDTVWMSVVASCTCIRPPVRMCKHVHVVVYNIMTHQQNCTSGKWQTCRDKDCSYAHVIQTIICCGLADPAKLGSIFSVITLFTFGLKTRATTPVFHQAFYILH